jgi:hypothetical protein
MIFAVAKHHKAFGKDFDIENAIRRIELKKDLNIELKKYLEKMHFNCRSNVQGVLKSYTAEKETKQRMLIYDSYVPWEQECPFYAPQDFTSSKILEDLGKKYDPVDPK